MYMRNIKHENEKQKYYYIIFCCLANMRKELNNLPSFVDIQDRQKRFF